MKNFSLPFLWLLHTAHTHTISQCGGVCMVEKNRGMSNIHNFSIPALYWLNKLLHDVKSFSRDSTILSTHRIQLEKWDMALLSSSDPWCFHHRCQYLKRQPPLSLNWLQCPAPMWRGPLKLSIPLSLYVSARRTKVKFSAFNGKAIIGSCHEIYNFAHSFFPVPFF